MRALTSRGHTRKIRKYDIERAKRDPKFIVYYTGFFGKSDKEPDVGNVTPDRIPERPSKVHDCIFFSNNDATLKRAAAKGWTVVRDPTPIKRTFRDNSQASKELKACPHHYPELRGYRYTCYLDTKMNVYEDGIHKYIPLLNDDVVMLVNPHYYVKHKVWEEYDAAMGQPRYKQDSKKYQAYIKQKEKDGYKLSVKNHYETSCILRKSGPIAEMIGEEWLADIQKTGPECQISFFFVQQNYLPHIRPFSKMYGRD